MAVSALKQIYSEPGWCIDAGTTDSVIARRNVLLGLWAGQMLGLKDEALTRYARETVLADLAEAGDDDLARKLHGDLAAHGLAMPMERVRRQIREKHLAAFLQVSMTD